MALTSDRNTVEREGDILVVPVAAKTTIFAGALVAINDKGFAVPGENKDGLKGIGRAEEFINNTSGDGAIKIKIKRGVFKFNNDTTLAVKGVELFKECYIKDDETVRAKDTGASAVNSIAGKVLQVDNDGVWVELR